MTELSYHHILRMKFSQKLDIDNYKLEGISIRSTVYNGMYAFIKKTDPQHQWNRLLSSFDLRLLRFYLYITYREFTEDTSTFALSKKNFTIPDNSYWHLVMRFVSSI